MSRPRYWRTHPFQSTADENSDNTAYKIIGDTSNDSEGDTCDNNGDKTGNNSDNINVGDSSNSNGGSAVDTCEIAGRVSSCGTVNITGGGIGDNTSSDDFDDTRFCVITTTLLTSIR